MFSYIAYPYIAILIYLTAPAVYTEKPPFLEPEKDFPYVSKEKKRRIEREEE